MIASPCGGAAASSAQPAVFARYGDLASGLVLAAIGLFVVVQDY